MPGYLIAARGSRHQLVRRLSIKVLQLAHCRSRIYVFDEWASDQDPAFKKILYMQLLPELRSRGKAIVVVSHDDRYFDQADLIVKLDYGKVKYDKQVHSQ